ncbi:hypothetical protein JCM30471_12940 [Desulfuromonas carbonis]|uniref:PilN domain-containing protein n=1 Tax=Desulfuromonas sp. DDH964 TaxID=1823759 RepID=UPI00078ED643|nr:PilN domain-containing protein [Desulfuromonas sp. DDH964]AMV72778.1 type II secretion system protein PulN [Desulfuromonas sp. DDH964]
MNPSLNLATKTYLNRRLLYAGYGVAMLLLLILLAGLGAYFWSCWQESQKLRAAIVQMERAAQPEVGTAEVRFSAEEYQRLRERIAFFNGVLAKDTFRWTDLLGRLERLVPAGIGLRSIQPDFRGRSLRISGLARNLDKLQNFLDRLLASEDIAAVYLLNQARIEPGRGQTGGGEELSFSLVLEGAF